MLMMDTGQGGAAPPADEVEAPQFQRDPTVGTFEHLDFDDEDELTDDDDDLLSLSSSGSMDLGDLAAMGTGKQKGSSAKLMQKRNLMLRYGVAHHKHVKEVQTLRYQTLETEPRSVANSCLQRLRKGRDELRLAELHTAFLRCVRTEKTHGWSRRDDFGSDSEEATSARKRVASEEEVDAANDRFEAMEAEAFRQFQRAGSLGSGRSRSQLSFSEDLLSSLGMDIAGSLGGGSSSNQDSEAVPKKPATAQERRDRLTKALRELRSDALLRARQQVRALDVRIDVGMETFVNGMTVFFTALAKEDRDIREKWVMKERSMATMEEEDRTRVENIEAHMAEFERTGKGAFIGVPGGKKAATQSEAKNALDSGKVLLPPALRDALKKEGAEPEPKDPSGGGSPAGAASVASNRSRSSSMDELASQGDDELDREIGRARVASISPDQPAVDFVDAGEASCREGFESLFKAVDCDGSGRVDWTGLLGFLMEASLLGRVGARELDAKHYELLHTQQSATFHDLAQVKYIKSRDQFLVGGVNVTLCNNNRHYTTNTEIKTPVDIMTESPHYRIVCLEYLPFCQCVAASTTESYVRFYHLAPNATRYLRRIEHDVNQTAMLFHDEKNLLFIGSRGGDLVSWATRYSASKGLGLTKLKAIKPHTDAISSLVQITTEQSIISSSFDRTCAIIDCRKMVVLRRLVGHTSGVVRAAHYADLNLLATASFDPEPYVWLIAVKMQAPMVLQDIAKPHIGSIVAMEMLSSTTTLATLCSKGVCKIWDLRTMKCQQTMHLFSQAYSPDRGFRFAALTHYSEPPSRKNPLGLHRLYAFTKRRIFALEYNLSQRTAILRNTADDEGVIAVCHATAERTYITASQNIVRVWDEQTSAIRDTFRCFRHNEHGGISSITVHPNHRMFYTGTRDGSVFARNLSTGSIIHAKEKLHSLLITSIVYCSATVSRMMAMGEMAVNGGLGDVILTVADDGAYVTKVDFSVSIKIARVSHPRCADFDFQSGTMIIGNAAGSIALLPLDVLTSTRSYPQMQLEFPKETKREIMCIKAIETLSLFVAADEEGHLAVFSLRYHASPYTCVCVWCHCSDTMTAPVISSLGLYYPLMMLYVGDENGFITIYDLRELLRSMKHNAKIATTRQVLMQTPEGQALLRQREQAAAGIAPQSTDPTPRRIASARKGNPVPSFRLSPGASPGLVAAPAPATPREPSSNLTPQIMATSSPGQNDLSAFKAFAPDPKEQGRLTQRGGFGGPRLGNSPRPLSFRGSPRDATKATPRGNQKEPTAKPLGITGPDISPRTAHGMDADDEANRRKGEAGLRLQMVAHAAVAKSHIDYTKRIVPVINRWRAHQEAVTSIEVIESAGSDHCCIVSSSIDQCVSAWKLSGSTYLGALEQYGRAAIPLTPCAESQDFELATVRREELFEESKRDQVILRSRGLLVRTGMKMIPMIPEALIEERKHQLSVSGATQLPAGFQAFHEAAAAARRQSTARRATRMSIDIPTVVVETVAGDGADTSPGATPTPSPRRRSRSASVTTGSLGPRKIYAFVPAGLRDEQSKLLDTLSGSARQLRRHRRRSSTGSRRSSASSQNSDDQSGSTSKPPELNSRRASAFVPNTESAMEGSTSRRASLTTSARSGSESATPTADRGDRDGPYSTDSDGGDMVDGKTSHKRPERLPFMEAQRRAKLRATRDLFIREIRPSSALLETTPQRSIDPALAASPMNIPEIAGGPNPIIASGPRSAEGYWGEYNMTDISMFQSDEDLGSSAAFAATNSQPAWEDPFEKKPTPRMASLTEKQRFEIPELRFPTPPGSGRASSRSEGESSRSAMSTSSFRSKKSPNTRRLSVEAPFSGDSSMSPSRSPMVAVRRRKSSVASIGSGLGMDGLNAESLADVEGDDVITKKLNAQRRSIVDSMEAQYGLLEKMEKAHKAQNVHREYSSMKHRQSLKLESSVKFVGSDSEDEIGQTLSATLRPTSAQSFSRRGSSPLAGSTLLPNSPGPGSDSERQSTTSPMGDLPPSIASGGTTPGSEPPRITRRESIAMFVQQRANVARSASITSPVGRSSVSPPQAAAGSELPHGLFTPGSVSLTAHPGDKPPRSPMGGSRAGSIDVTNNSFAGPGDGGAKVNSSLPLGIAARPLPLTSTPPVEDTPADFASIPYAESAVFESGGGVGKLDDIDEDIVPPSGQAFVPASPLRVARPMSATSAESTREELSATVKMAISGAEDVAKFYDNLEVKAAPEPGDPSHLLHLLPETEQGDFAGRAITITARHVREVFDSIYKPPPEPSSVVFRNAPLNEIVEDRIALPTKIKDRVDHEMAKEEQRREEEAGRQEQLLKRGPSRIGTSFRRPPRSVTASPTISLGGSRTVTPIGTPLGTPRSLAGSSVSGHPASPNGGGGIYDSAIVEAELEPIDLRQMRTTMTPPPNALHPRMVKKDLRKPRPAEWWRGKAAPPNKIDLEKLEPIRPQTTLPGYYNEPSVIGKNPHSSIPGTVARGRPASSQAMRQRELIRRAETASKEWGSATSQSGSSSKLRTRPGSAASGQSSSAVSRQSSAKKRGVVGSNTPKPRDVIKPRVLRKSSVSEHQGSGLSTRPPSDFRPTSALSDVGSDSGVSASGSVPIPLALRSNASDLFGDPTLEEETRDVPTPSGTSLQQQNLQHSTSVPSGLAGGGVVRGARCGSASLHRMVASTEEGRRSRQLDDLILKPLDPLHSETREMPKMPVPKTLRPSASAGVRKGAKKKK